MAKKSPVNFSEYNFDRNPDGYSCEELITIRRMVAAEEPIFLAPIRIEIREQLQNLHVTSDHLRTWRVGAELVTVKLTPCNEEIYDLMVNILRAEHRDGVRKSRCLVRGRRGKLVRCDENNRCSQCPYNLRPEDRQPQEVSWDDLTDKGFDPGKLCVVSPDVGRAKAAKKFQTLLDADIAIMHKDRPRHNQSEITALIGDVTGKICLINDDMIDTAGTLCAAADTLIARGAESVYVCATHGLFSGPAYERIENSKISEVVVTDAVPVPLERQTGKIKVLSIAPLVAKTIQCVYGNDSVSKLFD